MKSIEVTISADEATETATIECDRKNLALIFALRDGKKKIYKAHDLFECFGLLRADFPDIKFFCKGAKINVYPSRMASQMAGGIVAYELQLGRPAESEDIVNIFSYEDKDLTHDIQQQRHFYNCWIESLKK